MTLPYPLVPIGQVAKPVSRPEVPLPGSSYRLIGVRLWGQGAYERETIDGSQTKYATLSRVEAGDIVVNKIWARNGSVSVVTDDVAGCHGSNEFPTFAPVRHLLDPRWFYWITKTKEFWEQCDEKSRGTSGQNRIRPERFLEIVIPLPPLDEQWRIVARIEELAAKIEEARGIRQSADTEIEMAISRALEEFRSHLLSSDHMRRRLGEITTVTSGGTPSRSNPSYWGGTIPWIKTGELTDGDLSDAEEHITVDGLQSSSARLFPPDTVLIALYGQGQTRGRTARLTVEAATNQACCAILPTPDILEARYTQYWLRSLYRTMRVQARDGAQPNWNGKMIKGIEIVLPPLGEQRSIVSRLDLLYCRVEEVKRVQAATAAELDAMIPSILDAAFTGQL